MKKTEPEYYQPVENLLDLIYEHYTENNPVEKNTDAGKAAKAKEKELEEWLRELDGMDRLVDDYNWVKRLRQKCCVDLPASTGRTYRAPESQEVVRVEFHDTDPIPYEQPLNVIPAATERNNFSVAESMKLSVGSFHLTIPNGTDPQLLAQTLRIVKELEC